MLYSPPTTGHVHRLVAPAAVAASAVAICSVVWVADPTTPGGVLPVCPTKALLGIDCPGCGSLRMVYSLMHADFPGALRYNALGLVAVVLLLWAYGAWALGRLRRRKVKSWQHYRWAAAASLVLVTVWFVVRNLPFPPFSVLYV